MAYFLMNRKPLQPKSLNEHVRVVDDIVHNFMLTEVVHKDAKPITQLDNRN